MATEFSYEHVFRTPSIATLIGAYFDADHNATQDKLAELGDRTVLEDVQDDTMRKMTWRVTSLKPLPVFVKPFVQGGQLQYVETMTWRKATDELELVITPQILNGRVSVSAKYELAKIGEGQIRRRYKGVISAGIPLLSGKIERGVLAELEKSMPGLAQCTQGWLDKTQAP